MKDPTPTTLFRILWRKRRIMGQSSSSSTGNISAAQREAESLAAATGALPTLQKAFSLLSDSQTNAIPLGSLQVFSTSDQLW